MITIYQIHCLDEKIEDCYIGSTKDLNIRKIGHKTICNNSNDKRYNYKVYEFIRENGGFDNWTFKILNIVEFHTKELQFKMEQCYIDLYKPSLNTFSASITNEQKKIQRKNYDKIYRLENKTYIQLRQKKYYEINKDSNLQYHKEYRKKNNDVISRIKKEYYQINKEKIAAQKKEYYQINKEKIAAQKKQQHEKKKLEKLAGIKQ